MFGFFKKKNEISKSFIPMLTSQLDDAEWSITEKISYPDGVESESAIDRLGCFATFNETYARTRHTVKDGMRRWEYIYFLCVTENSVVSLLSIVGKPEKYEKILGERQVLNLEVPDIRKQLTLIMNYGRFNNYQNPPPYVFVLKSLGKIS